MKNARVRFNIEISKEFDDAVKDKFIQQIMEQVAARIAAELKWQVDNPKLVKEEHFNIDKFNVSTEYSTTKTGDSASTRFRSQKTTSSSHMFSNGSTMQSTMTMGFGTTDDFD